MKITNDMLKTCAAALPSTPRQEACAYDLRAALREEFMRYTDEGRVFPKASREMLGRVEAMIASMERTRWIQARHESSTPQHA